MANKPKFRVHDHLVIHLVSLRNATIYRAYMENEKTPYFSLL